MSRFQFSVRWLLGLVALVAVGCAALFHASPLWTSVVLTVTSALLLTAIVAAACRRGRARAFWLGFAVLGWGYFWVAGGMTDLPIPGSWPLSFFTQSGEPPLATTRLLRWSYGKLFPSAPIPGNNAGMGFFSLAVDETDSPPQTGEAGEPGEPGDLQSEADEEDYPAYESFIRVGESLWTLLFAIIGGLLGRFFHAREASKNG